MSRSYGSVCMSCRPVRLPTIFHKTVSVRHSSTHFRQIYWKKRGGKPSVVVHSGGQLPPVHNLGLSKSVGIAKTRQQIDDVRLNNLRDNPGAKKKARRIGRGIGSGRGKTSSRGHKGHNARSGGGVPPGFEGGQTPLYKKLRKFGFTNNQFKIRYETINLDDLQTFVESGRIKADKPIDIKTIVDSGLITKLRHNRRGIKLLGRGYNHFKTKVNIEISQVSSKARKAIEEAGGTVTTAYYDRVGLRYLLKPQKFMIPPRRASPPPKMLTRFDTWGNDRPSSDHLTSEQLD